MNLSQNAIIKKSLKRVDSDCFPVGVQDFSILVPQILSPNTIYLHAYPKNVMCLAYTTKKFIFWRPRLRKRPHCGTPKFCQIWYFLYICLF